VLEVLWLKSECSGSPSAESTVSCDWTLEVAGARFACLARALSDRPEQ
jgi:hypothetical protein